MIKIIFTHTNFRRKGDNCEILILIVDPFLMSNINAFTNHCYSGSPFGSDIISSRFLNSAVLRLLNCKQMVPGYELTEFNILTVI